MAGEQVFEIFRTGLRRTSTRQAEVVLKYQYLLAESGAGRIGVADFLTGSFRIAAESGVRLTEDTLTTHMAFWQFLGTSLGNLVNERFVPRTAPVERPIAAERPRDPEPGDRPRTPPGTPPRSERRPRRQPRRSIKTSNRG